MPTIDLGLVVGPQGERGEQGVQGPQGEQGERGETGATGAAGNGISSIVFYSGDHSPGTNDTYRITFTNGTHTDFEVYNGDDGSNGVGISSVTLISGDHSPGTSDTYRITFTNGTYTDFDVYNGSDANDTVGNPNLLDNPWFTVNQRGFTSGNFGDHKYTVDRWFTTYGLNWNGNVVLNSDNSLTFTGITEGNSYLMQPGISVTVGKTYTISVKMGDDSVLSVHGQLSDTTSTIGTNINNSGSRISLSYTQPYGWVFGVTVAANDTFTIRAVKLEPGSVSTLANDVAPNYTTELLKCQRYFVRLSFGQFSTIAIGQTRADRMYFVITLPTQMRVRPTLSTSGAFTIYENESDYVVSSMGRDSGEFNYIIPIYATATGLTNGVGLIYASTSAYIDFSADL